MQTCIHAYHYKYLTDRICDNSHKVYKNGFKFTKSDH